MEVLEQLAKLGEGVLRDLLACCTYILVVVAEDEEMPPDVCILYPLMPPWRQLRLHESQNATTFVFSLSPYNHLHFLYGIEGYDSYILTCFLSILFGQS